jgi:hypothetical protein
MPKFHFGNFAKVARFGIKTPILVNTWRFELQVFGKSKFFASEKKMAYSAKELNKPETLEYRVFLRKYTLTIL